MALMKRCFCAGSEDDFKEILGEKNIQLFSYREIRAATNNFDHDGTAFAAKAWVLYQQDSLLDMVDRSMEGGYPEEEALRFIKVALSCTQAVPCSRPTMRQVVRMLSRSVHFDELEMRPPGFVDHGGRAAADPISQRPDVMDLLAASSKAATTATGTAHSASVTYSELVPR
ncbi:hypothetical protein ABZP36_032354 [Zizania latifolia]